MKYIVYGGSGFLGSEIIEELLLDGNEVVVADIRKPKNDNVKFVEVNLLQDIVLNEKLINPDVIINLAGKLIFGRWNEKFKKLVRDTRVLGTKNIVKTFEDEKYRPKYLVNASAVGIYGDHGIDEIDEDSSQGNSFLSEVAKDWEIEAMKAKELGVNVRIIRNAHILGNGGLLGVLLPYYKWGIGGPLGNGMQYFPWVHIEDVAQLYINSSSEVFPEVVNAVAPEVLSNKFFSKTVAKVLRRPHIFWIPKFALKTLYGEFADEILVSQKVTSKYNIYNYRYNNIQEALENILN